MKNINKPLIGIVGKPEDTYKKFNYIKINNEIKKCVFKNGGMPVGILPLDDKYKLQGEGNQYNLSEDEILDLKDLVSRFDGIIMQGGYVSNAYEEEIIKICIDINKPILCICSGFNNMVRALGGTLIKEENSFHNNYDAEYVHPVICDKNSKLYKIIKIETFEVNSIHVWVTNETKIKNCKISAICPIDNTVEAIEVAEHKFAIGIKWHPEMLPEMNDIFKKFVDESKKTI